MSRQPHGERRTGSDPGPQPVRRFIPPLSRFEGHSANDKSDPATPPGDTAWEQCLARIKAGGITDEDFHTWVLPLQYARDGDQVWLAAPNRFVADFVENKLRGTIAAALTEVLDMPAEVRVRVGGRKELEQLMAGRPPCTEKAIAPRRRRRAGVVSATIVPNGEFPTPLTRLPVFVPGHASRQKLDGDHGLPFSTPWGTGRRLGPPLTIYDEDTLVALIWLRQRVLRGRSEYLPVPPIGKNTGRAPREEVSVHTLSCTVTDIQRMCRTARGGKNNVRRLESVRRLNATTIEFTQSVRHKLGIVEAGAAMGFLDVSWATYDDDDHLYVQFSPMVTQWLEKSYTRLDWDVRCQLRSALAKAVHRFLSGQPAEYQIFTQKLQRVVGDTRPQKKFIHDLRMGLEQMRATGWLKQVGYCRHRTRAGLQADNPTLSRVLFGPNRLVSGRHGVLFGPNSPLWSLQARVLRSSARPENHA